MALNPFNTEYIGSQIIGSGINALYFEPRITTWDVTPDTITITNQSFGGPPQSMTLVDSRRYTPANSAVCLTPFGPCLVTQESKPVDRNNDYYVHTRDLPQHIDRSKPVTTTTIHETGTITDPNGTVTKYDRTTTTSTRSSGISNPLYRPAY